MADVAGGAGERGGREGGACDRRQKKLFEAQRGTIRDFQPVLTWSRLDLEVILVAFSGFSAQNPTETLKLGQTKASNGFSNLKIRGYHIVSPWDPL